jgi:GTP-binding protein
MVANLFFPARFITSAADSTQYPRHHYPEIAFAGRSNVGKSSLINALLGQKKLVKTSSTPGRTQTLNFFLVNDDLCFVDLPGYGYAKVPASIRKRWGPMINDYLVQRKNLIGVILILDARRVPGNGDLDMLRRLYEYRIPVLPVATKIDKLSRNARAKSVKIIASSLGEGEPPILFSSVTGEGRAEIWEAISNLVKENIQK